MPVDRTKYVINEDDTEEAREAMRQTIIEQGRKAKRFKVSPSECPYDDDKNSNECRYWHYGYEGLYPEKIPSDRLGDDFDEDGSLSRIDEEDL